jgi:chromosome segregation ATPase
LSSCEEDNNDLAKTINILKEYLDNNTEDYEKLKEKLDNTRKELTLTMKKLEKFERSNEMLNEILSNQRSPTDKRRLGYNNSLNTTNTNKKDMKYEGNSRNYENTLRSGINNKKGVEE